MTLWYYEPTKNIFKIHNFTDEQEIKTEKESKMISLTVTNYDSVPYLLIVKNYIYFLYDFKLLFSKLIEEINEFFPEIYFYKCYNEYCYFIVGFINSDKQIILNLYKFLKSNYNIEKINSFTINNVGSNNFCCQIYKL